LLWRNALPSGREQRVGLHILKAQSILGAKSNTVSTGATGFRIKQQDAVPLLTETEIGTDIQAEAAGIAVLKTLLNHRIHYIDPLYDQARYFSKEAYSERSLFST